MCAEFQPTHGPFPVRHFDYLIAAEDLVAPHLLRHSRCPDEQSLGGPFMLCLTRPAIGLALVGVCLLGTRTFAADLVAAILALLQ
jgi:hypothetical protein